MRPTPQDLAQRLREMAAIYHATTPADPRSTDLVPATYMEWAAETIEEMLGRVQEACAACHAPTCHACFSDCAVCGRQLCTRCLDRVCPEHEVSAEEGAALLLEAEGFEDLGVDES